MRRIKTYFPIQVLIVILSLGLASCKKGRKKDVPRATFQVSIENTGQAYPILKSDAFTTPVGASQAGPLMPGEAYEFEFTAPVGAHLSLATMFAQSNDWFFAGDEDGIALYNEDGSKVTGDITSQIDLYDAGTEEDQEVGVGDNQAPRQSGPNTGPDDNNPNVRLVDDTGLPSNDEMIQVTLTSTSTYGFKVRIENVSTSTTLQTSDGNKPVLLSPGVWLVHSADRSGLLYTLGEPDYGDGLEGIAEDGDPSNLASSLADVTGLTVPLSPGAFAIYNGSNPIFMADEPAPENGLEGVAEDGQPGMLSTALESESTVSASGIFNQADGATAPGALLPGQTYTFMVMAQEGEKLSLATMYVQSNDLFYSFGESGIDLFERGVPVTGDVTDEVMLWDAGTEANEEPGVGSYQAPRQTELNSGPEDPNPDVRQPDDGYDYGEVASHIRITIQTVQNQQ